MDRRLSAQLNVESNDSQIRQIRPLGNLLVKAINAKSVLCSLRPQGNLLRDVTQKKTNYCCHKEGDFHRLRIQDIEDMLLLLVQGKVTNLNVEERIAFNVSLRKVHKEAWSYKRLVQTGGFYQGYPLVSVDVLRSNPTQGVSYEVSVCIERGGRMKEEMLRIKGEKKIVMDPCERLCTNPPFSHLGLFQKTLVSFLDEITVFYRLSHSEFVEIERSFLTDLKVYSNHTGAIDKAIFRTPRFIAIYFRRIFKDGGGRSRKFTKWQSYKMAKRLCLVDDLKMLKITMSKTSSRNKLNPKVNDHYNIFSRESQE
ncbi:hypothetical protein Tco_0881075 [Tanacetum coccineum]